MDNKETKKNKDKKSRKTIVAAILGKGATYQDKEEAPKDSLEKSRNKKDIELARRLKRIQKQKQK